MRFYKLDGTIITDLQSEDRDPRRDLPLAVFTRFRQGMINFNERMQDRAFFFVSNAANHALKGGIICEKDFQPEQYLPEFLNELGIELAGTVLTEATFAQLDSRLSIAARYDFIEDTGDILEKFKLDILNNRRLHTYGEKLLKESSEKEIRAGAEALPVRDTLLPELERIFFRPAGDKITGHPVHYFIEADSSDLKEDMFALLLQSLYLNRRIRNRRYLFFEMRPGEFIGKSDYDSLYRTCTGGCVLVYYGGGNDAEDEYASSERDTVEVLCETMLKYRNQVLTVFCFPRECKKTKELFYEYLGSTGIVELKEDFVSGAAAERYLKKLAKDNGVHTDRELFGKLEEGKTYLAPDLQGLFDDWFNLKLRNRIYPQYKSAVTARQKAVKEADRGSAWDELEEMIGLTEAKTVIRNALTFFKAQKLFADKGMKADNPAMHMVFSGNPGTAKTTVARLFARIMKDNGLLSRGHLVEVGRGDLVGKYVGWTAPTIKGKFADAKGGVLFIDEAYSLVDDRDGSFGDEAINTIVQEMENHREDVVVIFAGYPDKMEAFLKKNPGLRSRVAFHVPFADYSTEELCRIASLIAKKKGLTVPEETSARLSAVFEAARKSSDFGNGRYARNVIEKARMAQAARLVSGNVDAVSSKDIGTLLPEDIEIPAAPEGPARKRIGFCA